MENWLIVCGCLGALVPDIIRLIRDRYQPQWPTYFKQYPFWIGLALMVALGGVLAGFWAKSVTEALAYGFSGPEVISRLLGSPNKPPSPPSAAGGAPRVQLRLQSKVLFDWWGR